MKAMLIQNSTLTVRGKEPVHPIDVVRPTASGSRTLYFLFSKEPPITLDDKEVEFVTKMGPMEFKKKFKLADMVVGGKLEL